MSTAPDIEETLRHVAETVDVPRPDEAAFRRRVRRERGRVMAVRAVSVAAAAAVVVTGASIASDRMGPDSAGDAGREVLVAGPPKGVVAKDRPPVFLSVSGRLHALDPVGEIHDLGVGVEEIVGATPDGVIAIGRESHLVRLRAVEGDAGWRFERVDPPTGTAVQRIAVSQASGRAAWVTLDDELVLADLASDRVLSRTAVSPEARLYDVGVGALLEERGTMRLVGADGTTRPVREGSEVWDAATGGETVALTERGDDGLVTRVYDTSEKTVRQVAELPGAGDLSADGAHYLAAPGEGDDADPDTAFLWTRGGGEPRSVSGLGGAATGVVWVDEDTAAVTIRDADTRRIDVYTCDVATATCDLAMTGGRAEVYLR